MACMACMADPSIPGHLSHACQLQHALPPPVSDAKKTESSTLTATICLTGLTLGVQMVAARTVSIQLSVYYLIDVPPDW
jgi:hypothetical protein